MDDSIPKPNASLNGGSGRSTDPKPVYAGNAVPFAALLDVHDDCDLTLVAWARALEIRDGQTGQHCRRVADLAVELAVALGIPTSNLIHIWRGALLHDIGKIEVPEAILRKPVQLSIEEWRIMRQHPVFAYELLKDIAYLRPALDIPYCHHEWWDGSGYPRGLKGEQIPLAARLYAVVDVWDAMRADRPYRKGSSDEIARMYLSEQAGAQFDPAVVKTFLALKINDAFDERKPDGE
jgi:putative two-component system response regulator